MFTFIKQWLARRKYLKEKQLAITDEMREKSLAIRRLQQQIGMLEKQVMMKEKLNFLEETLGQGKTDSFEEKITMALLNKFLGSAAGQNLTGLKPQVTNSQENGQHLTDEQLQIFFNQNGNLIENIRGLNLTDNEIIYEIKQKAPDLADETVMRAQKIIREKLNAG